MITVKTKSTEDTLCNYCQKDFETCSIDCNLAFGNGKSNDNVIRCSCFIVNKCDNTYPIEVYNENLIKKILNKEIQDATEEAKI